MDQNPNESCSRGHNGLARRADGDAGRPPARALSDIGQPGTLQDPTVRSLDADAAARSQGHAAVQRRDAPASCNPRRCCMQKVSAPLASATPQHRHACMHYGTPLAPPSHVQPTIRASTHGRNVFNRAPPPPQPAHAGTAASSRKVYAPGQVHRSTGRDLP